MITFSKSLYALTAGDLMKRPVVTISQDSSLKDAAQRLCNEQISGAPVVNEEMRCVGVLSTTDFMRWAETGAKAAPFQGPAYCADWQVSDIENLPVEKVSRHMSRDVVMAERSASIAELARKMLNAHIHRVVIVDACCHPIGIVSSTDVLAALAYHDFEAAEG